MPKSESSPSQRASKKRRALKCVAILIVLWLVGDFGYSQYVGWKIRQWESQVPWSDGGFVPDAQEVSYKADQPSDTVLLMVHGFSDTPQMYRKIAPELASRGYDCSTLLLPGFGKNVEAYAAGRSSEWVAAVDKRLAELHEQYGHVVLVAHSLGGAISINQTLDGDVKTDALVLIAPAIEVSNIRSPILPTRFWHEFSKYVLPFSTITYSPFDMDAKDPSEQDRPLRNRFSPRTVVDETFLLTDKNRGRAGEIRCPTLVFNAVQDQVVDSPAIDLFFKECGASQKEIVHLSESGHMVPVDLEWKTVVAKIHAFLSVDSGATSQDDGSPK